MLKKSVALTIAIGCLAAAVPAAAVAAEVTYPAGTRAAFGQELTMSGTNITLTSASLGKISCKTLNLVVSITENNGTSVTAGKNNLEPVQSGCFNETELHSAKITNWNVGFLNAFEANGPSGWTKSATMSFTATVDLPAGIQCSFTGSGVPATYVSTASPADITFSRAGGISSRGGCGNATLDGSFSLRRGGVGTTPAVLH